MTEDERADWLARAIDDILRGAEPPTTPADLDGPELESLLRIAQRRLDDSRSIQEEAKEYEAALWERLVGRLESVPSADTPSEPQSDAPDLPDAAADGALRDTIADRINTAREIFGMAGQHKDEVWDRIKSRLGEDAPKTHWLPGSPRDKSRAGKDAAGRIAPDTEDRWTKEDLARRTLARMAEIAADPSHAKVRRRMRGDIGNAQAAQEVAMPSSWLRSRWRQLASVVAGWRFIPRRSHR
ncbi:MAG: hypothetical protein WD904_12130 [Dehalococcoidia bacterium]